MNIEHLLKTNPISRRRLVTSTLAAGAGALLLGRGGAVPAAEARAAQSIDHLVWVWQFASDGEPNAIGSRLVEHGLGITLKTHDGLQWMSTYDKSPYAVSGPPQIGVLAEYFENAGIPFHAWAVVHGVDPIKEARMAAEVIAAGARSIYLDIEPGSGFWRGTPADAVAFGTELRRLQPDARISLSIDARPWMVTQLPLNEFASFSDELSPQSYWRTFNTPSNYARFAEKGFPVGPEGITPEFLVSVARHVLDPFGLPLAHVGQGATPESTEFKRFIDNAYVDGGNHVTVWRYGVTEKDVFAILRDTPPIRPAPAANGAVHVVASGDTLGAIAATYGVTVAAIMEANGLTDPNYIYVGQELIIPGAGGNVSLSSSGDTGSAASAATASSGGTYTVVSGDTLYGIASRFGTTVDALVELNGIDDPAFIHVGQVLTLP